MTKYPLLTEFVFKGNPADYKRWVASLPKPKSRKTSFKRQPIQMSLFRKRVGRN